METPTLNRPSFRETYVIKPTITPDLWEVVGSLGNRVREASKEECIRWAAQLGLNCDLDNNL